MKTKYSPSQVFLHWLSAIVIIWGTISGFFVALFEPALAHKEWVSFVNVSLTTLFIPFFIARLIVMWRHGKPNDHLLNKKEEKLASLGHALLYINISVVLISGVLMMERPINVFNWFSIPQPLTNPGLTQAFNFTHILSCATLGLLVVGHVLAVLKHQYHGKALLRRMSW
jgi:cytochrome b561